MASAPVLGQITYSTDTSEITANWTSETPGMFRLSLFKNYATDPIQSADWPGGFGILSNPALNTTDVFTVAVAQLDGTTVGSYSNPVPVIVGPPRDVRLEYDGEAFALSWTVPAGATVAAGAEIVLRKGTDLVDNIGVDGTRTVWLRDEPLDPAVAYTITVSGTVPASYGPQSAEIPVIQSVPDFAQLVYSVYEGDATIDANNGTPNNDYRLHAELHADDVLLQTAQGSAAVVSMSTSPLGPWALYTVRIAYGSDGSRGPWTNTLPVLVQPAQVIHVAYDGTNVRAEWDWVAGEPSPAGASVAIVKSDGAFAAGTDATGKSVQFVPSPALTANTAYTLSATATRGNSISTVSAGVPVLTFNVAPTGTAYDGAGGTVTWSDAAHTGVTKMQLHLLMGGQIVQSQLVAGGSATMPVLLSQAAQYTVALQTLGDVSSGPLGNSLGVIACVPQITKTKYTANGASSVVRVEWNADGQSTNGVASWSVQLWEDGVAWKSPVTVAAGTHAADVSPGAALDASKSYTATVRGINGTTQTGALSEAAPILAEAAPIVSASYDGANVGVTWSAVGEGASYVVRLTDSSGTQVGDAVITGGRSAVLPLASAASGPYKALVRPFRGLAQGSEASLTLLTSATGVQSTSYDGAILNVRWAALSGATSFVVQLRAGGETILEQQAAGTSADLAVALAPAGSYEVYVRGVGTAVTGPPGTSKSAIAAIPSAIGSVVTSSQITVTWNASTLESAHGVTGYSVQLWRNGVTSGDAKSVSGAGTGTTNLTLGSALDAFADYAVTVQATGANATGALSAPASVIAGTPLIARVAYDGTNVVVSWAAHAGVSGYKAQLVDNDGAIVGSATSTSALEATLPLTTAAGKTYRAQVSALAGSASGAFASVGVLIETMSLTTVAVDADFLDVKWSAATETVTGYEVRVYDNGVLLAAFPAGGTQLRIFQPLDPAGVYTATVRPVAGVSVGQESSALALISAVPEVTQTTYVTGTTNKVTVTWNAAVMATRNGVTGYSVQLFQNGAKLGSAVTIGDKTTGTTDVTLSGALDAWDRTTATVQAAGTNSTGTASEAAGVIASIPTILSADIAGFGWSLSWTAATEEIVTGYRITVTDANGGNAQTFDTAWTSLDLSNTFANNQCLATVQAVGANATGQASAATNLYGSGASYFYSATGSSAPAYVFRASSIPAGPSTITLYLPDLFNETPSIQNDVFVLTKPATSPSYPYLITVAQSSVAWQFTGDARAQLWTAYIQFLTDLDVLVNGQPQLKPGALFVITQILGRALPLLFAEQLGYVYRFNGASGYIDLVPGMRLRIDSEARQYSGPPGTSNVNINGFVSSGTSVFDLGEYWQGSQLNTGFNSYLSLAGRPTVPSANTTGGAAGGLDFYQALNRMPLFRLLYPAQFPATNVNGYADLTDNIVIIGASLFGDLQGATNQYVSNGNFSGYESKISQTWFRGRAVITPEIPILVNGTLEYVAVGTTVRQLLGMFGGGAYPAGGYAGGLAFRRAINNIVDSVGTVPPEAIRTNVVRIADLALNAYGGGVDALDLPVIQGDSFTFLGAD